MPEENLCGREEKKDFLKGAEIAYETILTSFASGDVKKLKSLLTSDMFDNFEHRGSFFKEIVNGYVS